MSDAATEPAAPRVPPPPPPLPVFTEQSFQAFVSILEDLAILCDTLEPGAQLPIPESCELAVRTVGKMFATLDQKIAAGGVSPVALHAWAARAAALGSICTHVMVQALAVIAEHVKKNGGDEAVLLVPEPPPAAVVRPTLPPHLQAVIGAHTFSIEAFSIETMPPRDFYRVTCHTCQRPLAEVRELEIAELVGTTHAAARGGEKVEWVHPTTFRALAAAYDTPTCKRCGCSEGNACLKVLDLGPDKPKPVVQHCSWAEINPETNAGTCSACAE